MTAADPSQPVGDTVRVLLRHKGKVAACVVAILAATALITITSPRAYRSQAKLFVRLGRENATLDPTATVGSAPVVGVQQTRDNEINTAVEILKSRVVLEKVADAIGPGAILGESKSSDPATQRYYAITRLGKQLDVEPVKKSAVLAVTYLGPSPEQAQAVVAKLLDNYLDRHMQLSRSPGSHQFLAEQTTKQKMQLTKAEDELRDLKNGAGLIAPESQRQLLITRLAKIQDDLLQTNSSLAAAEAESKLLREKLSGLSPTSVTARVKGIRNEAADNMRSQLYTLQLRELELRQKYPAGHPEIEKVRQQAAAAKEILDHESANREQITEGPNHIYEEAQLALFRQGPVITALRAKAGGLRAQLDEQKTELRALNDNDLRIHRQEREVALQESQYRRYAENLEQAQIDQALEAERLSNISIIQPATLEIEPVRPRVLVNFLVGLMLAFAIGAGVAFVAERLDRSVKSRTDLEAQLGLPVLGSVPHMGPAARNRIEVLP
jgi:uncharacterized protein involved in exopolysaccharide biosynthesis